MYAENVTPFQICYDKIYRELVVISSYLDRPMLFLDIKDWPENITSPEIDEDED